MLQEVVIDTKRREALDRLFEQNVSDLTECVGLKGEYSAAAQGFLLGFRDRRWVEELLSGA
jgi:hypothetical protein